MTNFTNKVVKKLTFDEQKEWHNKNNWSIFQDHLVSKGATTYRHPISSTAGLDEKVSFLGNENQINHFNANPADIAKNIMVSRNGPQWEKVGADIDGTQYTGFDGIFFASLSADGSVMALGSNGHDGIGVDSGIVKVYKYHTHNGFLAWHQLGEDIHGEAIQDQSGFSVSLSADGSRVAIGAKGNDDGGTRSGHVRVYEYDASKIESQFNQSEPNYGPVGWNRIGEDIDGEGPENDSGFSVSLSNDGLVVAIGSIGNNDNGYRSGHVRIFRYHTKDQILGWHKVGYNIEGEEANDQSGISVSLSADGSVVAIGSTSNNDGDNNLVNRGHVRIYRYKKYRVEDNNTDGTSKFNYENRLVNDSQTKPLIITESIQIAPEVNNFYWTQLGLDIDGEETRDQSGKTVSLSADGSIVAIGAPFNDTLGNNSGQVRVYQYDATKTLAVTNETSHSFGPVGWNRIGGDIDGELEGSASGFTVSISADGLVLAIGSGYNVHVYLYDNLLKKWNNFGDVIVGDEGAKTVSLSGDGSMLSIGFRNDAGANKVGVYQIAKRNPWVQQGLDIVDDASNLIEDDDIGKSKVSVSLSNDGKVLAMGSMLNDGIDGNQRDTGLVRVFENTDGLWKQKGQDIYGVSSDDLNGSSVSLSGDGSKLAVGALTKANDTLCYVRVYEFNLINNNWDQVGETIYGEAVGDESGWSVSLSADGFVVAIGAPENGSKRGHVRVYRHNPDKDDAVTDENSPNYGPKGWDRIGGDIDGEETFDKSGWSVSLSDDGLVVAIGAPFNDNGGPSGHVRVYRNNPGKTDAVTDQTSPNYGPIGWDRIGGDIDGDGRLNLNGSSVSLSGDGSIVAISDINNAEGGSFLGSGHVRVYRNNLEKTDAVTDQTSPNFGPVGWDRIGGDIDGLAINDQSGYSVSLSTDGSVVAIGAPGNDANGNNSGHVRVYKNINNIWIKQGEDIEGEKSNYLIGAAVSLSSDGLVVAIGGPMPSSDEIPRVRVYKFTGWGLGT